MADDADGDLVPDEPHQTLHGSAEAGGDQTGLAECEEQQSHRDECGEEHEQHGPIDVETADAEHHRGLEQLVDELGLADDVDGGIALRRSCPDHHLLHSSSLSRPLDTATASQPSRLRYATTTVMPSAARSTSVTRATASIVNAMRPSRRKNPSRAAA